MPSLESLSFDTTGLHLGRTEAGRKVWFSESGDGVSLNFFNKQPDLPSGIESPEQLRNAYLAMLKNTAAKLVEVRPVTVSRCRAIRLIIKVPQQPNGMTYVGSITVPFRDFSYVIKAQCEERGMTGLREAVMFEKLVAAGKVTISDAGKVVGQHDYDDEQYDSQFPQHPLSRLRNLLNQIETSCAIAPDIQSFPTFPLP
jgi:hypothetical protein